MFRTVNKEGKKKWLHNNTIHKNISEVFLGSREIALDKIDQSGENKEHRRINSKD